MNLFKKYKKYLSSIDDFFNIFNSLKNTYISNKQSERLKRKFLPTYRFFKHSIKPSKIRKFIKTYSSLDSYIELNNSIFTKNNYLQYDSLLSNIDGKSLDQQQRLAVLSEDQNNLVIAGAGSGKTLTISGKVKYLIDSGKAQNDEILLISFTDKAVKEMTERLQRINIDVNCKTFHKLGLDIISSFQKSRPQIATDSFINNIFNNYFKTEILNFPNQMRNIIIFLNEYFNIPENITYFTNLNDYLYTFRNEDYETIESRYINSKNQFKSENAQKQTVQRLDDLKISNFLFLNGIKNYYNYPYPHKPTNSFYKKIKTNFYLSDYDIHLEHFSIDKKGHSKFLTKFEEQKYLEEIKLKRDLHSRYKTNLIETYAYYNENSSLINKLELLLHKNNITLTPISIQDIYNSLYINNNNIYFNEFIKLLSTFLSLFKSNNLQINDINQMLLNNKENQNIFLRERNEFFLNIFSHFYDFYQSSLLNNNLIDFNDMINNSTEIVKIGFFKENYKYIIIDEYQDISVSRYKLIKAIQRKCNSQIFCVGDDWQSIYRFSGSDIDLFSNFHKYFPNPKLLRIEKTYRNSQELIDIAGKFVVQNPNQITKNLKSDKHLEFPLKLIFYKNDISLGLEEAINQILIDYDETKTILLLGRTKFDIVPILQNNKLFISLNQNNSEIQYKKIPNLKILFMTVHKSKGLEADNVIILNMKNGLLGFPSKITNDPILSFVLNSSEDFPYSEERRLFYVAITRTKNNTYLLAPEKKYSCFVKELIQNKSLQQ